MKKNEPLIIVEQTFNKSIEKVWRSITEIDHMRQWYFENIPDFKPEIGFETQFMIVNKGRKFLHLWKVTEVIPQRKITYTWKFKDYAGDSYVDFDLFEQKEGTKLRLTVHVLEDFSDDIPEFRRESCIGGWEYFIKKRLKEYLEKP